MQKCVMNVREAISCDEMYCHIKKYIFFNCDLLMFNNHIVRIEKKYEDTFWCIKMLKASAYTMVIYYGNITT